MKWFVVLIGLYSNPPTVIIEDNQPFAAPDLCWAAAHKMEVQNRGKPGADTVKVLCGMNAVAADFVTRAGQ